MKWEILPVMGDLKEFIAVDTPVIITYTPEEIKILKAMFQSYQIKTVPFYKFLAKAEEHCVRTGQTIFQAFRDINKHIHHGGNH